MVAGQLVATCIACMPGCIDVTTHRIHPARPAYDLATTLHLDRPSVPLSVALIHHGLDPSLPFRPHRVLRELSRELREVGTSSGPADLLALAELHEMSARACWAWDRREAAAHDFAAMSITWPLLRDDAPAAPNLPGSGTRGMRALTVYNAALEHFLRVTEATRRRFDPHWQEDLAAEGIPVTIRTDPHVWDPAYFDNISFTNDYIALHIRKVLSGDGIGIPMFGTRTHAPEESTRWSYRERFLPQVEVHPITAVARFDSARNAGESGAVIELHDEVLDEVVAHPGGSVPLAWSLSTPLAYHLTTRTLKIFEQLGLWNPMKLESEAGLKLFDPYQPGKIPIVFVHGLGSSPRAWLQDMNELRGDPELRRRYQFWLFFYPSGNPYIHSAMVFRESLNAARARFDPGHNDPAFDRMVLVGHSMGGLLSKLAVQSSGDNLWRVIFNKPFDQVRMSPATREGMARIFFFEPIQSVERVVFIATPHHGSRLGNNFVGRLSNALIRRPDDLTRAYNELRVGNGKEVYAPDFQRGLVSSIDLLREGDPMIEKIAELPMSPRVKYHTIVGRIGGRELTRSSDGVVTYESAHLDGATSELVIPHNHFVQDDPRAVAEIARILREHLDEGAPATLGRATKGDDARR